MKRLIIAVVAAFAAALLWAAYERVGVGQNISSEYGPEAALKFAQSYRGLKYTPDVLNCHPDAKGIPFSDTKNIIAMSGSLWTPAELAADFQRRMVGVRAKDRKRGIIVMLKTERCCTKEFRACTVTTAVLEKRAAPLAAEFLIYGAWIKPRDGDRPPGSLKIETGADSWKNDAAGIYGFEQGPGATLVFLNPADGSRVGRTDALRLGLSEKEFIAKHGHTPKLDAKLQEILGQLNQDPLAADLAGASQRLLATKALQPPQAASRARRWRPLHGP